MAATRHDRPGIAGRGRHQSGRVRLPSRLLSVAPSLSLTSETPGETRAAAVAIAAESSIELPRALHRASPRSISPTASPASPLPRPPSGRASRAVLTAYSPDPRPPWPAGQARRRRIPAAPCFLVFLRVRHRLNRPLFGLASHFPALLHGRSALPQVPWPPWAPVRVARPFWPISGHARWSYESAMLPWCSSTPPLPPLRTTVAGRASAGEAAAVVAGSRGRPSTGSLRPSFGPPIGAAGHVDAPGPLLRRWRSPRRPKS